MKFAVTFPDGESLDVTLKSNLTGSTLLAEAYTVLSIPEDIRKYFGLTFIDKYDGGKEWIEPTHQLKNLKITKCNGFNQVEFSVCVYPRDPHLEFPTRAIRRLFRQHLKNLLVKDILQSDSETSVTLDALLLQAELGDFDIFEGRYSQKLGELEIYAPITLLCGTSISEKEYQRRVREKHASLKGTSSVQADVMFLNFVQTVQGYGCVIHDVSDSIHKKHSLLLSPDGAIFIYDEKSGMAYISENRELFPWNNVIDVTQDQSYVMLHLSTALGMIERKLKLRGKDSEKKAQRLAGDLERYRSIYCCTNYLDDDVSPRAHSAMPLHRAELLTVRREKTMGGKLSSWKESIKRIKSSRERNVVSP